MKRSYNIYLSKGLSVVVLGLCFSGVTSHAKTAKTFSVSCFNAKEISSRVEECEDNEVYAEAGVLCLESLQKIVQQQIKQMQQQLASSVKKNTADSVNKQKNTFKGSSENQQIMQSTLDALILASQNAKQYVESYRDEVVYPSHWDIAEDMGQSIEDFMNNNPCYADTRDVLASVSSDIDRVISDLQKTKKDSSLLEMLSNQREQKLDENMKSIHTPTTGSGSSAQGVKSVSGDDNTPNSGISDSSLKKK